jgi:GNAT superfamily N-acetyltransferase
VTGHADVHTRLEMHGSGGVCSQVLATLPTWFGIPASVEDYITTAEANPTVVASVEGRHAGLLTLVVHNEYSAEIYVMGVDAGHHRRGVGRAMLETAESWLAGRGVEFLQVKTLSARRDDAGYAKTRAFYAANGFRPLQEFPELWGHDNPALQMIKVVSGAGPSPPADPGRGAEVR